MGSAPGGAASIDPALLAMGLGAAAAAAAAAAQQQQPQMSGAIQGALAGYSAAALAAPARQPSGSLQAQAALLLSGMGHQYPDPDTIAANWGGMAPQDTG